MALVLGKKESRKIRIIAEEFGDFDTLVARHSFDAEFKLMPNTDWMDAVKSDAMVADLARENLIGIEGVTDDAGVAIPYSEALKAAVFNETWLVKAINNAFLTVQGGNKQTDLYKKERQKN